MIARTAASIAAAFVLVVAGPVARTALAHDHAAPQEHDHDHGGHDHDHAEAHDAHDHGHAHDDHGHGHDHHHGHDHGDEVRGHGAHVHGAAQLAIAAEGDAVEIVLTSALWNLVGFERAPATDEERAEVKKAVAALSDGAALFGFDARAGCTLKSADPGFRLEELEAMAEAGHKDVIAAYAFACDNTDRISNIAVGLFEALPRLEKIEAAFLGDGVQAGAELTPGGSEFALR